MNEIVMKEIHRTKLKSLIDSFGSKIFEVSFRKKDGSVRDMVCQRGNRLEESPKRPSAERENTSYLLVSDVKLMTKGREQGLAGDDLLRFSYRLINLSTVTALRYQGTAYQIVD